MGLLQLDYIHVSRILEKEHHRIPSSRNFDVLPVNAHAWYSRDERFVSGGYALKSTRRLLCRKGVLLKL